MNWISFMAVAVGAALMLLGLSDRILGGQGCHGSRYKRQF